MKDGREQDKKKLKDTEEEENGQGEKIIEKLKGTEVEIGEATPPHPIPSPHRHTIPPGASVLPPPANPTQPPSSPICPPLASSHYGNAPVRHASHHLHGFIGALASLPSWGVSVYSQFMLLHALLNMHMELYTRKNIKCVTLLFCPYLIPRHDTPSLSLLVLHIFF